VWITDEPEIRDGPRWGGVAGAVDAPDLGGWAGTPALNPEGEH